MGDDQHTDEETDFGESGDETDIEDNLPEETDPFPSQHLRRKSNPELPETVEVLTTEDGCKVYLVGTAHFSEDSQNDVAKTILQTQPDVVVLELCNNRINILSLDEETLLREAKTLNLQKIRAAIRNSGVLQGILHIMLLSLSAHITKQLGMAPGGEFRAAVKEAQKIPGCRIRLGDRPIGITLRRALHALSLFQKLNLAFHVLTCREPIKKEDVEKCKQKDILEEMLLEMTGEYPELSRVFVAERDAILANSLRLAAAPIRNSSSDGGFFPSVIVGVVGIGHVPGIVANWNRVDFIDVSEFMKDPSQPTRIGFVMKWTFRLTVLGAIAWGCNRVFKMTIDCVHSYHH